MIDHIISLSKRAYLFAADTDNETLLSTFQVEKSDFHSLSEPEKIILAQNILLSLNSNNVDLIADYDITALELTTVSTAITTAQNEIAAPSTIIGNNKTSNVDIEAAYILVDEKVALLEKSILGRFLTGPFANLSLTANFELAKKLVESTRHTALLATITNTLGAVMEGVLVEINFITENREATSNISGIANVEQFEGGTYYVTYSAIGFITQVIATKFTLGKTTSTSIVLIKTI